MHDYPDENSQPLTLEGRVALKGLPAGVFGVAVAVLSPACDAEKKDDGSTTGYSVRVVDLGDFAFCSANDPLRIDDLSWLFAAKYRLSFVPGVYPVEDGSRLPYRIEVRGEERAVIPGTASLLVEQPEAPEYDHETELEQQGDYQRLRFNESFELDPPLTQEPWWRSPPPVGSHLGMMYGVSTEALALAGGEFVIDGSSDMFLSGALGPWIQCSSPSDPPPRVRVEVTLEGGDMVFNVRPVHRDAGLIVSAEGTFEGQAINVTDYDRLAYSRSPVYAVRFDEPWPDGECALYVQERAEDGEPLPAEAWVLDCDSNKIRAVVVHDLQVILAEE